MEILEWVVAEGDIVASKRASRQGETGMHPYSSTDAWRRTSGAHGMMARRLRKKTWLKPGA